MKILAFDTTGEINSASILDAGKIVDLLEISGPSSGAELLVPGIDEIMNRNNLEFGDLDAIAVAKGPSSFTSVRIGLSCAKGLVLASKKPLLTYDSLFARAFSYREFVGKITICIDAKMDEFFVAEFVSDGCKVAVVNGSRLVKKSDLASLAIEEGQVVAGSGASFLTTNIAQEKEVLADNLALMAYGDLVNGVSDVDLTANYLRLPQIGKKR